MSDFLYYIPATIAYIVKLQMIHRLILIKKNQSGIKKMVQITNIRKTFRILF